MINKITDEIKTAILESEKQTTVHKETLERKDGKIKELQNKIRKLNRWRTQVQTGYKHFQAKNFLAKHLSTDILTISHRCKRMRSVSRNINCRNMTYNMIWLCISNRS